MGDCLRTPVAAGLGSYPIAALILKAHVLIGGFHSRAESYLIPVNRGTIKASSELKL